MAYVELLPCPFCGVSLSINNAGLGAHPRFSECIYAQLVVVTDDAQQVAKWNTRANLAPLQAENERLRAEVERLMGCLATANANHEQFERQWYLERDRAERLAEALRNIRRAALDGCSAMDCARDAYDALALEDRNEG